MKRNRGTVAVLAMIFLGVFTTLGLSFLSIAVTSTGVAREDRNGQTAAAAAESGVAMLQRLVGDVIMTENQAVGEVAMARIFDRLKALNGTATMEGKAISFASNQITIPEIALHSGSSQRMSARIYFPPGESPTAAYATMRLEVIGRDTSVDDLTRKIDVALVPMDRTMLVFGFGVFSRGRIDLADGKASIIGDPAKAGSIGSAYTGDTAIYLNGGQITGEVAVAGDPSKLFVTGAGAGSIAGVGITNPDTLASALEHVHEIQPPTIPVFMPNLYNTPGLVEVPANASMFSSKVYSDIRITKNMKFSGGDVLQGTIYVKPGVTVEIGGGVIVRGVIVVEDPNLDATGVPIPGSNLTATSTVKFTGVPIFDTPTWPAGSVVPLTDQQALSPYSFLGPSAYIFIQGSGGGHIETSDPHEGFARTVVTGTLEEYGSGIVNIRNGTLITLSDTQSTGTKGFSSYLDGDGVRISQSADYTPPLTGYKHLFSWVVDMRTYQEVSK